MKVVLAGVTGKMGQALLRQLDDDMAFSLAAAIERPGHPTCGSRVGQRVQVVVTDNIRTAAREGEVIVDFSHPELTMALVAEAQVSRRPMVIGTTGFTSEHHAAIRHAASDIPIVLSPNMSVGVNVLLKLIDMAARALGEAYDVEILEIHHRQKQDAPSGTALRMGEAVAQARAATLEAVGRFARSGTTGPRRAGEIGIQSLRGGDVVGEHTITFAGPGERIELTHRAHSRDNFARGALLAARWIAGQSPGCYDMLDVLRLRQKLAT